MEENAQTAELRLAESVPAYEGCPLDTLSEADWLGSPVASPRPHVQRFLTDLSLPVRHHSPNLVFRKAAYVDIGPAVHTADGCELEVTWQSSSLAPLFPVFAGKLVVTSTELRLEGLYAPPGGQIGLALDRAFVNIAARGTGRWFLGQVSRALAAPPKAAGTRPPVKNVSGQLSEWVGEKGPG